MAQQIRSQPASPVAQLVGANARSARKRLGWSQRKVAKMLGVSEVSYSRIETGRQLPPVPRLDFLARCLGVPLEQLFATEAAPAPEGTVSALIGALPAEEQEFILRFVMLYTKHWRATHVVQLPPVDPED